MKKLLLGMSVVILLVALSAFATEQDSATQKITPTAKGNVIIRASATSGIYAFTNGSENAISIEYARILSSGTLSGATTSLYTRTLAFFTNKVAVVQTNYAGTATTNWMYGNFDGSTTWTNTMTNTVSGTEFDIDFNDKLILLIDEVLTIKFPVTTNTYYLDIHATKE